MSDAESARFQAFLAATDDNERDWIAFCEFEEAIHNAVGAARMTNMYDAGREGTREVDALHIPIAAMLFRVLPKVDLGTLIGEVEGIGYAIQYGVIQARPDALDHINSTEAFQDLARQGHAAERAAMDQRVAEIEARRGQAQDE